MAHTPARTPHPPSVSQRAAARLELGGGLGDGEARVALRAVGAERVDLG